MTKNHRLEKIKLNRKVIADLKEGDRIQDTECPSLWVTCGKEKKTFFFLKKWKYRQFRKTIGDAMTISRDRAIAKCGEYLALLQKFNALQEGPSEEPSEITLQDAVNLYLRGRDTQYGKVLIRYAGHWMDRRLCEIKKNEVRELFDAISKTAPVAANRFLSYLRAAINRAKKAGMYSGENVAASIDRNREKPRQRYLTMEEAGKLIECLQERRKNAQFRDGADALLLMLYTWQRSGNVTAMEWSEITREGDRWTWTIQEEKAKAGKEIVVPLIPEAIAILKDRKETKRKFVFQMPDGKHILSVKTQWNSICRELGLENVHIHDLRHTGATWALRSGADITTVSAALGHASVSFTARVYAHVMTESKLEAARGALAAMTAKKGS